MDSDYLSGGYARQKELDDLEKKLLEIKDELSDAGESGRGRPHNVVADEVAEIEAKIRLLKTPTDTEQP